jgi:hypothetical protein
MVLKRELYDKVKNLGIKNISKMNKKQLEEILIIHETNNWFNDLIDVSFTIVPFDFSGNKIKPLSPSGVRFHR